MLMAAGFFIATTLGSGSAYFGPVLVSMVLMAVGLGLVTSAVDRCHPGGSPARQGGGRLGGQRRHP
jgi:hypothetical protein